MQGPSHLSAHPPAMASRRLDGGARVCYIHAIQINTITPSTTWRSLHGNKTRYPAYGIVAAVTAVRPPRYRRAHAISGGALQMLLNRGVDT